MSATSQRAAAPARIPIAGPRPLVDLALAALLLLMIAAAAAAILLAAVDVFPLARITGWLEHGTRSLAGLHPPGRIMVASLAGLIGVASLALLAGRFRGGPAVGSRLVLSAEREGIVAVSTSSVQVTVEGAVRRVAGVLDASAQVRRVNRGALVIHCRVMVCDGSELPAIGAEARQAAAVAVRELVGLTVQGVVVELAVLPPAELERVLR